ncbi:MAG TPA: hydroxyacid-oxoacid transhydrogenase [Thermomicrobiales bacterium]|nr:hydroxyacid-oxoacid transhydrogenase [Thermomicrobiales bacterium]
MPKERIFTADASAVVFGPGATNEVGARIAALGCRNVMVITDRRVAELPVVANAVGSLEEAGVAFEIFADVRVEPTDASWQEAIDAAVAGGFDGFVSIGGGSSIDTAKIANLYATWPADFMDYVYPPLGSGVPVPGPIKPHIAIPTTAGTGSETTGNAVFDLASAHVKTAISHRYLRPTQGIIDPDNTRTMPPMVAACSGLDVLCHALESYTAIRFDQRDAATDPLKRTVYQGGNPLSDLWAARAIELGAANLVRAVNDPDDEEARAAMFLASTTAGIGFGNAGVHLPHAMSYPVSALARDFVADGYPADHTLVPHGMSVILTAPAIFRWTAEAGLERHLESARLLGADTSHADPGDAGELLADTLIAIMKQVGMPNGLNAVGITENDLDGLVQGTLPQSRITQLSPRVPTEDDYREIFRDSMTIWSHGTFP